MISTTDPPTLMGRHRCTRSTLAIHCDGGVGAPIQRIRSQGLARRRVNGPVPVPRAAHAAALLEHLRRPPSGMVRVQTQRRRRARAPSIWAMELGRRGKRVHLHGESHFVTKLAARVQPAETGADDHGIQRLPRGPPVSARETYREAALQG